MRAAVRGSLVVSTVVSRVSPIARGVRPSRHRDNVARRAELWRSLFSLSLPFAEGIRRPMSIMGIAGIQSAPG